MNTDSLQLSYNAADCYIYNCDPTLLEAIKQDCLRWEDNSIKMFNNINRYKRWYKPQDPSRYCLTVNEESEEISFPTGLLIRVMSYLDSKSVKYDLRCLIETIEPSNVPYPEWAYKHQLQIRDKLFQYYRCVCRSGTGSGKTTSISMLCSQFPKENIIIVLHEQNLMLDMQKNVQDFLTEEVGIVYSKKVDWKRITVVSGKTLAKHGKGKYKEYCERCKVLILDECHHYANKTGLDISSACYNTVYRLGLTATPNIETGADLVLEGVIGPLSLYIDDSVTAELGITNKPIGLFVKTNPIRYKTLPVPHGSLKPDRDDVVRVCIIENEWRNRLIAHIVCKFRKLCPKRGLVLITIDDVKYGQGEKLKEMLKAYGINSDFISGDSKNRKEITQEFREGRLDTLIATSILNEGIDIPSLEVIINGSGGSGIRNVVQKTGRSIRVDKSGLKLRSIYIDFIDEEDYYLYSNSLNRFEHFNNCHPGCGSIVSLEELLEIFKSTYRHD